MSNRAISPTWRPEPDVEALYRAAGWWHPASITDDLRRCVERFGDRVVVRDSTTQLTFAQVWDRAAALAAWLRKRGLGKGEAVAVQLPNWTETVVAFHGVLMAGGVVVPMTTILRRREVGFILRQTGARFAVVAEEFRGFSYRQLYAELVEEEATLEHVLWARSGGTVGVQFEDALASVPLDVDTARATAGRDRDVALVIYTSGTTADPKGAIHTHEGLASSSDMCQRWFALNENDVLFNPSPVSHITGVSLGVLFPAAVGCSVTLQEVWQPQQAFDSLVHDRTTFMIFATPFLAALTEIAEEQDVRLEHIRTIVCGGADVPDALARRAQARLGEVVRMYGGTECPNASSGSPWDPQTARWGTEGRWLFPTQGRVVAPDTGRDATPGEVGEAWWRGPQLCAGYVDAAMNSAFTDDGSFRTGDLVSIDTHGWLTVRGRIKDIINRGGEKFSTREIEDLIAELPGVLEVAVTSMPDPRLGERACAWVVLKPGATLELRDLTNRLRSLGLATHKLPERLEVVDEFPRTPSGKLRKNELRERLVHE
jgi:cyclohexanecarboxylate-CoA ligase